MRTLRICRALFRASLSLIVEYRGQVMIWSLAGITPLIMMFVWRTLAEGGDIAGRGPESFALYFLAAFLAGQCTQAWAVWNVDYLVRSGVYAVQLLRPFEPWFAELMENVTANGFRLPLNLAVVALGLWLTGSWTLVDPWRFPAFLLALALAWQVAFNINYALALLGLWTERIKSIDTWNYIMLYALGGALFPLDLLSPDLRRLIELTPYPWIVGYPVDALTGRADLLHGTAMQLFWIAASVAAHRLLWRRGLLRFGAVGG